MIDIQDVSAAANATRDAVDDGIRWVDNPRNAAKMGDERSVLLRELRRLRVAAGKLRHAAHQPMCVGVFGPSQAGKSYLVSALARSGTAPPVVRFEDREVDFLREINPEGGKESTGLVTRFSIRVEDHPPGFPVCLRLLTEADIVKILGNTFFLDIDLKGEAEPTAAVIRAALDQAKASAGPAKAGLTEEDVWDIQEYFETQFAGTNHLRSLQPLWDEAARYLPRLDQAQRAEILSLLWGRRQPFTDLYSHLAVALGQLGHAAMAFCPIEALLPRQSSIIDVATLAGLGSPDPSPLQIRSQTGPTLQLPRAIITALTAEIRLVLKTEPRPFFAHTDLLDFPGARSRQRVAFDVFFAANAEPLKESFLRGKVAYLFDRYVADQELTAMLLVIPDGNIEVMSLPDMINDWIARTHGATPVERSQHPCSLFFVMSKFDVHFVEKDGADEGNPGTRFANRVIASLTDNLFARAHSWPHEWEPGRPFSNCFWLRNPSYPAEAIIVYENKQEVEHRPDKLNTLKRLREAYLSVPEVVQHFADPAKAWDEALRLNDGGVGYIADSLSVACDPQVKAGQVAARLAVLRRQMIDRLAPFHIAEDLDTRLAQRRDVAHDVIDGLYAAAGRGRFPHLLRALQVRTSELADVLYQVEVQPTDAEGREIRVITATRPTQQWARPGGSRQAPTPSGPPTALTREEVLAAAAIRSWISDMHRLVDHPPADLLRDIEPGLLRELTTELIAGARQVGLAGRIAEQIRQVSWIEKSEAISQKAAIVAARAINRFVAHLGFDAEPVEARPRVVVGDASRPVFAPRAVVHDIRTLGPEPRDFGDRFIEDWAFAFFRRVEETALGTATGEQIDIEQNAALGSILKALATPVLGHR